MIKTEVLFFYESRQNPNGDPGFENQPRRMPDETILVTDVRIKRTMRDYAKSLGHTLFADFAEDGLPDTADRIAKGICAKYKIEVIQTKEKTTDFIDVMLKHTFDVPLFGALVTLRPKKTKKDDSQEDEKGGSQKLTGPMQFAMGRSVNKVDITNHSITSRFVGDKEKGRHTTIGSFYAVDYALIKTFASINPQNLIKYLDDDEISKKFSQCKEMIPDCLWHGTNNLVSRSKYPQRSILYVEVNYKEKLYNDLSELVDVRPDLKERATSLGTSPFIFDDLISVMNKRKDEIDNIKIRCIDSLDDEVSDIVASLPNASKI